MLLLPALLMPPLLLLLLLLPRTLANHSCLPSSAASVADFEFAKSVRESFLVGGRGCRLACLLSDGLGAAVAAVTRIRDGIRTSNVPYICW
jgi:hypothetical protein